MNTSFIIKFKKIRFHTMRHSFRIILILIICSSFACNSGKYCVGGKKKYKRMKKDTNLMVF